MCTGNLYFPVLGFQRRRITQQQQKRTMQRFNFVLLRNGFVDDDQPKQDQTCIHFA